MLNSQNIKSCEFHLIFSKKITGRGGRGRGRGGPANGESSA